MFFLQLWTSILAFFHVDVIPVHRSFLTKGLRETRDAVPPGTPCTERYWCSRTNVCARICERGTVEIEPWMRAAIKAQAALARSAPYCHAVLPGTHNSAITAADGYGVLDQYFTSLLDSKVLPDSIQDKAGGESYINTANQLLSLTDQMELGVRIVEMDIHYIEGALRIAHCGNRDIDSDIVHLLLQFVGGVYSFFGAHFRWDTSLVGCNPSMSSIPASEQRLAREALLEISQWTRRPENSDEVLLLYVDTAEILIDFGKLRDLTALFESTLGRGNILTRSDLTQLLPGGAGAGQPWPSLAAIRSLGRRFILVTRRDLPGDIYFRFAEMCAFEEPHPRMLSPFPGCAFYRPGRYYIPTQSGATFTRMYSCELSYGPLNCGGRPGTNQDLLTAANIPTAAACAVNSVAPDNLDVPRARALIWSWAPGFPASLYAAPLALQAAQPGQAVKGAGYCAFARVSDGRWEDRLCPGGSGGAAPDPSIGTACRIRSVPDLGGGNTAATISIGRSQGLGLANATDVLAVTAGAAGVRAARWAVAVGGPRGACAGEGTDFAAPRDGLENAQLRAEVARLGLRGAWVGVSEGPEFKPLVVVDTPEGRAGTAGAVAAQ